MATAGNIKAGKAYVEMSVDDSAMQRGLKAAQARLQAFAVGVQAMARKMALLGAGIMAAFAPAIKAASDMETAMRRFNAAFGSNARAVEAWAENYAKAVGRSKRDILDLLAVTQNSNLALEFDPATASQMSKILTTLAVDLASFTGAGDAEVMSAMQAAISGSTGALAKYGIALSKAAVDQQLLKDGMDPDLASDQHKALARLALVMQQTSRAQGEAVNASNEFAVVTRGLRARLMDLAGAVGKAVMPVVVPWLKTLQHLSEVATRLVTSNEHLVVRFFQLGEALSFAGLHLGLLGQGAEGISGVLGIVASGATMAVKAVAMLGAGIGFLLSPIGLAGVALVLLANHFIDFRQVATSSVEWVRVKLGELMARMGHVVGGMRDALVAGDLKLAARILWLSLKTAWQTGIVALESLWADWGGTVANVARRAFVFVAHAAIDGWARIKHAWYDARDWFDGFFSDVSIKSQDMWSRMTLGAQIAAIAIKKAFDWSFDAGEATGQALMEYGKKQLEIQNKEAQRKKNIAGNTAGRNAIAGDAAAQKAQVDAIIGQTIAILAPDRSGDQAQAQDDLTKATAELEAAIREAASKRGALPVAATGPGATQFGQADLDQLRASANAATVEARASIVGSFNSAALGQMMGSVTLEQRATNAAEATARNTDDIARHLRENQGSAGGILIG